MEIIHTYYASNLWGAMFNRFAESMQGETHLLPQDGAVLERQFKNGLSAIAIENGKIVGHTTLWEIATDWYEIGTTFVAKEYRGKHINKHLYEILLNANKDKNILETTTNEISIHVGQNLGFITIKRDSLPSNTFVGACICKQHKTASSDPLISCKLAWNGDEWTPFSNWITPCHVRVTLGTFQRNPFLKQIPMYAANIAV